MQAIKEDTKVAVLSKIPDIQQVDQILRHVVTKAPHISPEMNCEQTLALFRQNPQHESAVLVDGLNRPIGLMMRNELFRKLSQRFSADLFSEKPIERLADKDPLIVDVKEEPQSIIEKALSREGDRLYDCVIVIDGQVVLGILTMSSLLELSNQLQRKLKEEQLYLIYSSQERIKRIMQEVIDVKLAASASEVKSEEMVDLTLEGKTMLQNLTDTLESLNTNAKQQQKQISELKGSADIIKKITTLVRDLADQSNLLAINATIEAARAGQHGKAFSVVAQEVMNLAGQTKQSALNIANSIDHMVHVVSDTVDITDRGIKIGLQSDKLITDTQSIFLTLFKMVAQNKADLKDIGEQANIANEQADKTVNELKRLNEMNM